MSFGTFERGGQQRTAATPAQAVKLAHDGWVQAQEGDDSSLELLTIGELRELAESHGISLHGHTKKQDIIDLIEHELDHEQNDPGVVVTSVEEVDES